MSTILTFIPTLLHHGMIYVGLPYAIPETMDISEVRGGSPTELEQLQLLMVLACLAPRN